MKNELNDIEIKRQLESLDTLSVGVVFGRDEAWEKLQSRLDRPKHSRPVIWLAAASLAALLIWIIIPSASNTTAVRVAVETTKPAAEPQTPEIENELLVTAPPAAVKPANIRRPTPHIAEPKAIVAATESKGVPEQRMTEPEQVIDPAPGVAEVTSSPAPAAMPIVHISELERKDRITATPYTNSEETVDIRTLPVIHERDVMTVAEEMREIRRGNRFVFRQRGLPYDVERYDGNVAGQRGHPSFLRNMFNTQN